MQDIPSDIYSKTSTQWQEVKTLLRNNCNDDTPFLLMPVRLETRFMTINRKIFDVEIGIIIKEVDESLDETKGLSDTYNNFPFEREEQIVSACDEIIDFIHKDYNKVSELESLLYDEHIFLLEAISNLENSTNELSTSLSRKADTDEQLATYNSKSGQISDELNQLKNIVITKSEGSEPTENTINNIFHYEEKKELWVRIYPDDIHVETHEKLLTSAEEQSGIDYWNIWWTSNGDRNICLGAWRALCELYGSQRAAWIIKQTEPTNLPSAPEYEYFDPTDVITDVGIWLQSINDNDLNLYCIEQQGAVLLDKLKSSLEKTNSSVLPDDFFELYESLLSDSQVAFENFTRVVSEYERADVRYEREDNIEQNPAVYLSKIVKKLKDFKSKNSETAIGEIYTAIQQNSQELETINEELNDKRLDGTILDSNIRLIKRVENELMYAIRLVESALNGERSMEKDFSTFKTFVKGKEEFLLDIFNQTKDVTSILRKHIDTRKKEIRILDYRDNKDMILETQSNIKGKFHILEDWLSNQRPLSDWNIHEHLPEIPEFQDITNKSLSWTEAAKAETLPDRFVALGLDVYTNDGEENYTFKQLEVGKFVPSSIIMGPDPSTIDLAFSHQINGDLVVDDGMNWMFDFNEAVKKGMGIIMELEEGFEEGQEDNVFDKLIVLGLKTQKERFVEPNPLTDYSDLSLKEHSKEILEKLFENHHYSGNGMSLLKIGTPTNNTDSNDSGFNFDEDTYEDSFEYETKGNLFPITDNDHNLFDGQRICDILGIDYSFFQHIENADNKGISNAKITNGVLWDGTMGYHLQELFTGFFTRETILNAKQFFNKYVTARGIVPSLRVGKQPYGILPATSFSRWKFAYEDLDGEYSFNVNFGNEYERIEGTQYSRDRFHIRMKSFFDIMMKEWLKLANQYVLYTGKSSVNGAQKDFTEMLGLHATSAEYYSRHAFNIGESYLADEDVEDTSHYTFDSGILTTDFPGNLFQNLVDTSVYPNHFSNYNDTPHITRLMYTMEKLKLWGPSVDSVKLSNKNPIGPDAATNYINWIKHASLTDVWNRNDFNTSSSILPSRSLLFYLLRQSYLFNYIDSFVDVMNASAIGDFSYFHLNNLHYYKPGGSYIPGIWTNGVNPGPYPNTTIGKWYYFFNKLSDIENNFYNFNNFKSEFEWYTADNNIVFNTDPIISNEFKNSSSPIWNFSKGLENKAKLDKLNILLNKFRFIPSQNLERLMQEHLDLCSYRLDAWVNGLIHQRIEEQRFNTGSRKTGVYLGAYGWLDNIKPGLPRNEISSEDLPGTLKDTNVKIDGDNLGYIHGPSMGHALTAAILRSGYISNQDSNNLDKRMSINLSSERVRMALKLIDGVRSGQSVGALLGYQFERGLHERYSSLNLDSFIYKFRKKYPINEEITPSTFTSENIIAQNVVNGVDLLGSINSIISGGTIVEGDTMYEKIETNYALLQTDLVDIDGNSILPNSLDSDAIAIIREIDLMANAIDSLADLAIAEGVFQVTRGNYTRASAVVESITSGLNPQEPEIVKTPRTGSNVTHKFIVNIEKVSISDIVADKPWSTILTPRAKAEPTFNKWFASFLPNPVDVKCMVTFENESGAEVTEIVTLENLNVQPIDFIYLMSSDVDTGGTELLGRISYYLRENATTYFTNGDIGIPYQVVLNVQLTKRDISWTSDVYSFFELTSITRELNFIISNSKSIQAQDFEMAENATSEGTNPQGIDIADLQARVTTLRDDLEVLLTSIDSLSLPNLTELRSLLMSCSSYGIINSIPEYVIDIDNGSSTEIYDKLTKQLEVTYTELDEKRIEMNNILSSLSGLSVISQKKKLLECATILFGKPYRMSVHFSLHSNTLAEIQEHITVNNPLLVRNHSEEDIDTWQYSLSRVRRKIASFETISNLGEHYSSLTPIQIPYKVIDGVDDYWYGLEFPEEYNPTGHKTSLVFTDASIVLNASNSESITGIVLDEWLETIPNKEETSGLTFNYDQPNSKPPQNILLAVSPDVTGNWDWNDLICTLLETQKLAKIRAVEPDQLSKNTLFGHLLPSVMAMTEVPNADSNYNYFSIPDEWKNFNVTFPYEENIKSN